MSEAGEGRFTKARLEAFSDAIIAVIITLMVLDLKAPEDDSVASLLKLWPSFLSYVVSFGFAAIYWINHHHIISMVRRSCGLFQAGGLDRHFRRHRPDLCRAGPPGAPADPQFALASREQSA